jgi:thiosulfate sulfurtransferase
MVVSRISCEKAHEIIHTEPCHVLDIRDPQAFRSGHPSGAILIDNNTLPSFLKEADPKVTTLVFCYHGNSSQQAALYLQNEGFSTVHSVDGGVEMWRQLYPAKLEA